MMAVSSIQPNDTIDELVEKYGNKNPMHWGEKVPGVKTKLVTNEKAIALTLDACGSRGDSIDIELLNFLIENNIPATLFVTKKWIDENLNDFKGLCKIELFDIQNHGWNHRPASVNGKTAYGIPGTANIAELVNEVEVGAQMIEGLTGKRPLFFRSGGAYYDEVATQVIKDLGYQVAGFSVRVDPDMTDSIEEVPYPLLNAKGGEIVRLHMNYPNRSAGPWMKALIPKLVERGFFFVHLKDYKLQ